MVYSDKRWYMVATYSLAHFIVDFSCAFLMFRSIVDTPKGYLCVLLYNSCAFAMQMPLGILADNWNKNVLFAIIGCSLVGIAYGLWLYPFTAACVLGVGNAMFHLGGGIDVLNVSKRKSDALGVFVSPGAFGIYIGTALGKGSIPAAAPILLAIFVTIGLLFAVHRTQGEAYPMNAEFSLEASPRIRIAIVCFFIVVCLRSYVGLAFNFPWKNTGCWGIALVCAVVLGKTAGGFLADRFGMTKTVYISLGFAALLFLVPQIPALGIMSVLLFNMTMPITLWVMAKILPGAKGFSFGLLTFGLFLGFLPVYLGVHPPLSAFWLFAFAAAVSLVLLRAGLRKANI